MDDLLIIALCLGLNSFLSAFEMAFVSISKVELRGLVRQGNRTAQRVLDLRDRPERTLSVIQVGITLVGALSAAVGGAGAADTLEPMLVTLGVPGSWAESLSIGIVVLPLTYLSVVFGELIPKTLALRNPAQVALFGVRFVRIIDSIFSPIIGLFEASTTIFLRILSRGRDTQSRPEENAVEITHFTPAHREIILNMAAIEKRLIRDFFVPWERVVHVDFNDPIEKVIELIFSSSHTRYPVTQGPIVAGIINAKEVLAARESGITDWLRCLRPAISVQSQDTALHALKLLQEKRSHLAIVDKRAGIVTLEDINEEIFGEIYDEHEDGRVKKLIASTIKTRGPASEPR